MAFILAALTPFVTPVLSTMMAGTIIGTLFYSTKDSAQQSQALRDKIEETKKSTKLLKDQYDSLVNANVEIDANIKADILNALDQHSTLSAEIVKKNNEYNDTIKKIQLTGISIVTVIFVLLLLKKLKILDINLFSQEPKKSV
jgi:hypothetical protein